jgi:hypothetical protein
VAHDDLTQGMAHGGHVLLGNHEIARTSETTPVTGSYLIQTRHVLELDPIVEMHPEQWLCLQNACEIIRCNRTDQLYEIK